MEKKRTMEAGQWAETKREEGTGENAGGMTDMGNEPDIGSTGGMEIQEGVDARPGIEGKQSIGKYTVIRKLGQGGEGSVYLARDESLERLVALKEIRADMGKGGVRESVRIIKEADHLQRLKHPMLPVIYDLLWGDVCYMVMEYIQGITLHEYIERNGYVCEENACRWAEQLLDILEYLHTRKPPVVYRDLKPDNIMVCPDGRLRLVDFGAADQRSFGAGTVGMMAVTPGYGAPEQLGMAGETKGAYADERSDIYAFGKVLYYMVTGADPTKPPYTSLSVRDYQPLLRERVEQIIRKCIRQDPSERYQMAEEVRSDLNKCGRRKHRLRRRAFIRIIEKKVWLTEK